MELKKFFAKGTAAFINGPAILLNSERRNPPHWVILDIWTLESFTSADILFSKAFLKLVFFVFVNNNS